MVRIATHPDYQRMGYGSRALQLLIDYYSGIMTSLLDDHNCDGVVRDEEELCEEECLLKEVISPRHSLPPLLSELQDRRPEELDYIGVSFGLTSDLLRWVLFRSILMRCFLFVWSLQVLVQTSVPSSLPPANTSTLLW